MLLFSLFINIFQLQFFRWILFLLSGLDFNGFKILTFEYGTQQSLIYSFKNTAMIRIKIINIEGSGEIISVFLIKNQKSGFLTSYILLKKFRKHSSPAFFLKLYLHRYLRLTLVYGICILFFTGFLGRYGTGTYVRYRSDFPVENCMKNWWKNILYISNVVVSQPI